jgi:pimeloyl-ACP methyl ester carboxylesterase
MSKARRAAVAATVAAVGGAAAYLATRAGARRLRQADDPHRGERPVAPPGSTHRLLPSRDGGEISLIEAGPVDAQPLVLLHGITLRAEVWTYQLRDLAGRFRVIAMDQRGHGRSRAGSEGYSLRLLGDDTATVLEALDLHDAILVGHSMGGMGLMQLCGDHADVIDERVAGVVFLSTSAGLALPAPLAKAAAALVDQMHRSGERKGWDVRMYRFPPNDLSYLLARRAFGRSPSSTHIEWTRELLAETAVEASYRSGLALASHDGREALEGLKVPALVVVGSRDRVTPPMLARRIVDAVPDGRLEIIPDAGHQLMLERPAELAALLTEFADSLC